MSISDIPQLNSKSAVEIPTPTESLAWPHIENVNEGFRADDPMQVQYKIADELLQMAVEHDLISQPEMSLEALGLENLPKGEQMSLLFKRIKTLLRAIPAEQIEAEILPGLVYKYASVQGVKEKTEEEVRLVERILFTLELLQSYDPERFSASVELGIASGQTPAVAAPLLAAWNKRQTELRAKENKN
ncbi:hypothetical protein KAZ57_00470 [Patescibacteria group bacterium]|nr:hypothetical protein [Patescibacteria group bacterium]